MSFLRLGPEFWLSREEKYSYILVSKPVSNWPREEKTLHPLARTSKALHLQILVDINSLRHSWGIVQKRYQQSLYLSFHHIISSHHLKPLLEETGNYPQQCQPVTSSLSPDYFHELFPSTIYIPPLCCCIFFHLRIILHFYLYVPGFF